MSEATLAPRMKNPAALLPNAFQAIQGLIAATKAGDVPPETLELIHLRVSQINGCSACVESGLQSAQRSGVSVERIFAVTAWRDSPHFTEAERAALRLAEAVTRLADNEAGVSDEVWDAAAEHYDERALAAVILSIATTNVFNRLNATTRQVAGRYHGQA
jgi:AhpD family alkylhydroperoxidase